MLVKILILIITVTLIANEFYNFLDDLSSRYRKIILFSVIGLLTLLSLVDIYNDDKSQQKLEERTENILQTAIKTADLQSKNNTNIHDSRKEIGEVDSILKIVSDTLTNQVSLLNLTVLKSNELTEAQKKISYLQKDALELSSSIKNITESNQNLITGGGAYPIITFGYHKDTSIQTITVSSSGPYPIRDLSITIRDNIGMTLEKNDFISKGIELLPHVGDEIIRNNTYYMKFENVYPDRQKSIDSSIINKIFLENRKTVSLFITIETENLFYNEFYKINDIWGNHTLAQKVMRNGKLIISADKNFPRTNKGEVDFTIFSSDLN